MGKRRQERLRDLSRPQGCKPGEKGLESRPWSCRAGHSGRATSFWNFQGQGASSGPLVGSSGHTSHLLSWSFRRHLDQFPQFAQKDRVGSSPPRGLSVTAGLGAAGRRHSPCPSSSLLHKALPSPACHPRRWLKRSLLEPTFWIRGVLWKPQHRGSVEAAAPSGKTWACASDRPL